MKPLFRGVLCCLALVPVLALAVFDLSWLKRYNPSQLVGTRFDQTVSKPGGGGFYAVGLMAEDAFVALFDLSGNLVTHKILDSPYVTQQYLVKMWVDGSDVFVYSSSSSESAITKFDASLNKVAEVDLGGGSYEVAYEPTTNRFYVGPGSFSSNSNVRCLDANGVELWNIAPSVEDIMAIAGDPAGGCVVSGTTNEYESIQRFNTNGASAHYRVGTGTSSFNREINSIVIISGSTVVGAGASNDGSSDRAAIFTLSSTGTLTKQYLAGSGNSSSFSKISPVTTTSFRGIYQPSSELARVVDVTRTTGSISRTYLPAVTDVDGSAHTYGAMPVGRLGIAHNPGQENGVMSQWDTASGNYLGYHLNETARFRHFGNIGSTVAVASGDYDDHRGLLRLMTANDSQSIAYQFAGGARRTLRGALPLSGGAVVIASSSTLGLQSFDSKLTIVKYNSNGSVAWARGLGAPEADSLAYSDMTVGPDGAIYVACVDRLYKLNGNTGAQIYSRVYFEGSGDVNLDEIAVDASNQVYALGYVEVSYQVYEELRVIFDANGYPITRTKTASANQPRFEAMHVAPNGKIIAIATPWVIAVGVYTSFHVRQYSTAMAQEAETTLMPTTPTNPRKVSWSFDSQGEFLVAAQFSLPEIKIYRFPAGTAATANLALTLNGQSFLADIESSPARDRVYLALIGAPNRLLSVRTSDATIAWSADIAATVTQSTDLTVDTAGNIYLLATEDAGATENVYAAKYLTNGVRSAQRRLAGKPHSIHSPAGQGFRIIGEVGTRNKGWGPFVARYD